MPDVIRQSINIHRYETLIEDSTLITFDQLYANTPYSVLTGTEIVPIQGGSGTGGTILTTLKAFFKNGFVLADVTDVTSFGSQIASVADLPAAKTLLEIPDPTPAPLAPITLSANSTLGGSQVNRRVFIDTATTTFTLDSTTVLNTDALYIVNVSAGDVTLNAGAGEDMILWGVAGTATTYTIPSNYCVKAYLVDSNTWFIEY